MNFDQYQKVMDGCISAAITFPGGKDGRVDKKSMPQTAGITTKVVQTTVIFPGANDEAQLSVTKLTAEIAAKGGQVDHVEVYAPPVPRMLVVGRIDDLQFFIDVDMSFPPEEYLGDDLVRSPDRYPAAK